MRFKYLKLKAQKSQKRRSEPGYSFIRNSKKNKIISSKGGRFEFIYFFFIKKFFKKVCVKTKLKANHRKVLFYCYPNYPLTKKSKNSRMGSGKGYFLRWAILLKRNSTVIFTKKIPKILLLRIVKLWNLSIPFKVNVV